MAGSPLDAYTERTLNRSGLDRLPAHLEHSYGIRVAELTELDAGVFRVDRRDGPAWVARVFPAARPAGTAEGDAGMLRFLAGHDFPAERWATTPAVTVHEDQAVLVTGYLPGGQAGRGPRPARRLGELLGPTLSTRPSAGTGWVGRMRRSTAPDDPAGWLSGHGWTAEITSASDVLAAYGRIPARGLDADGRAARQATSPRALLVAATH